MAYLKRSEICDACDSLETCKHRDAVKESIKSSSIRVPVGIEIGIIGCNFKQYSVSIDRSGDTWGD
jgi:hypothetical protein